MPPGITLAPGDFAVLNRIPLDWWDENIAGAEISRALEKTSGDTMRRISRLVTLGLVQRRHNERGAVSSEIRRLR